MADFPPTTLKDVPRADFGDLPAIIVPEPSYTITYAGLARGVEAVARQLVTALAGTPGKALGVQWPSLNRVACPRRGTEHSSESAAY
jgi:hypothetical protein